jgi:hypothetical protein
MQKLLPLFILIATTTLTAHAQEEFSAPDYEQIERNVKEPASSYFYPDLMKKYMAGDEQMTLEEGRYLYFGFIFQPQYTHEDSSPYNQKLADVLSKKPLTPKDYTGILEYSDSLLLKDPFNLRALNAKLLVFARQDNAAAYKKTAQQRRVVQNAIVGSGDGISEETPFYVINVAHEYDILPFLGYNFGGEDTIVSGKKVNCLSLTENWFGIDKVYFDITPVIDRKSSRGGGKK